MVLWCFHKGFVSVRSRVLIKDPDIKECVFHPGPKPCGTDVGASFGRRGGGTSLEHLTTQGLQLRLHRNIVADLRQQGADDVPDFIVADGWDNNWDGWDNNNYYYYYYFIIIIFIFFFIIIIFIIMGNNFIDNAQ